MELNDKIRTERETRRLTRAELGKILGVSGMTVGRWERGTIPEPGHLRRLAEITGQSMESFFSAVPEQMKRLRIATKIHEQVERLRTRTQERGREWTALETLLDMLELWSEIYIK